MDSSTPTQPETHPFDFRQSSVFSDRQMRALQQRHEELIRALADRLTLWLRFDFTLRLARVAPISYADFIGSLPGLTHLSLFKLEPLRGVCLLETPPPLAIAVVERLLGGQGERLGEARELTEVEIALFDQWVQIFFEEWKAHFPEQPEAQPQLLGHESAPRFLQSAPPETMMMEVVFEAEFGDGKVPIQIAYPCATLEPLLRQLAPVEPPASAPTARVSAPELPWNTVLDDMKLAVSAQWHGLEMTARELTTLKIGDVVRLPPQVVAQVRVRLAGKAKFSGRLGTCGGHWAVELTSPDR